MPTHAHAPYQLHNNVHRRNVSVHNDIIVRCAQFIRLSANNKRITAVLLAYLHTAPRARKMPLPVVSSALCLRSN